jgi:hypothetical protein
MKFYIAADFERRDEVQKIYKQIIARGQTIICDWTNDQPIHRPYDDQAEAAKVRSIRDINAVLDSDVFVLLTEEGSPKKGKYVELGAVLVSNMKFGKPKIYVIGDFISYSMFHFHPLINRKRTIRDVFADLEI